MSIIQRKSKNSTFHYIAEYNLLSLLSLLFTTVYYRSHISKGYDCINDMQSW